MDPWHLGRIRPAKPLILTAQYTEQGLHVKSIRVMVPRAGAAVGWKPTAGGGKPAARAWQAEPADSIRRRKAPPETRSRRLETDGWGWEARGVRCGLGRRSRRIPSEGEQGPLSLGKPTHHGKLDQNCPPLRQYFFPHPHPQGEWPGCYIGMTTHPSVLPLTWGAFRGIIAVPSPRA